MAVKLSLANLESIHDIADRRPGALREQARPSDYFVVRDGLTYAGTHLLIELWDAINLVDADHCERALRRAADAAGATVLHLHIHRFASSGGISGIAVLAESHISIHTWPERAFAALDIFMCGDCDAYAALPVFKEAFEPGRIQLSEAKRGLIP